MGKKRILFLCTGNSCRSQMKVAYAGFDDPPRLAQDAKTEEETLRWVHTCLAKDPQAAEDAKRLKVVRKADLSDLCVHYRN